MEKEYVTMVAKTIQKQLFASVNRDVVFSWGSRSWTAREFEGMATLSFRVSGFKHRGVVNISYNRGDDLYVITIAQLNGKIKKRIEGVYCDQLGEIIDRLVEKGDMSDEEYRKKIGEHYSVK